MAKAPIRITIRSVGTLTPGAKDQFYWDADLKGFGVKVTPPSGKHPEGTRTYVYQYRMGGRATPAKRKTIGRHGSPWTPTTARDEAERLALLVGQGVDPVDQEATRHRETIELNFRSYAEAFIKSWLPVNWPGNHVVATIHIRNHAIPTLGGKALPAIRKADIAKVIDALSDRGATAFNTYAVLRRLFRYAVERGDIEASIFDNMKPPRKPKPRERVLSHEEISLFWEAAAPYGYYYGKMMLMLLLTGQRRGEVAHLPWAELSRRRRLWALPPARAKNDTPNLIPLSDLAVAILDEIAEKQTGGDGKEWPTRGFVFSNNGVTPINNFSRAKVAVEKKMKALAVDSGRSDLAGMPNWRMHDLRRTIATNFQRLGIAWEVTEAVLNHVGGAREGIAGIYQQHKYLKEKRVAMQTWADRLKLIIAGGRFDDEHEDEFDDFDELVDRVDNVVPIAAARA